MAIKKKASEPTQAEIRMAIIEKVQWCGPMTLKQWCPIYGYKYETQRSKLAAIFKNPDRIRAKRWDSRRWQVHILDLPAEYFLKVIWDDSLLERGESE